jgi:hypothetical protein
MWCEGRRRRRSRRRTEDGLDFGCVEDFDEGMKSSDLLWRVGLFVCELGAASSLLSSLPVQLFMDFHPSFGRGCHTACSRRVARICPRPRGWWHRHTESSDGHIARKSSFLIAHISQPPPKPHSTQVLLAWRAAAGSSTLLVFSLVCLAWLARRRPARPRAPCPQDQASSLPPAR